jgi:hypothetical protein
MPHTDQQLDIKNRRDGLTPPSWLTGDTDYQKAAVIAAMAWHEIKAADDPELTAADLTFRENCIGVVESLIRGNEPDSTPFAQVAERIWKEVNGPSPTNKELDHA